VGLLHLEDLRGILLGERDSGTLVQIPHDLYQTTALLVKTLQQEVIVMDDPFSDEARILIEKVASIRTTAEELFHLRSEKIVSLAQSQADGSYIEREELRMLIPAELEMFNRIVDGIRACRIALIEWKAIGRSPVPVRVEIPERISDLPLPTGTEPIFHADGAAIVSATDQENSESVAASELVTESPERAYEQEEGWTPSDDEDDEPFAYTLVRVLADMEPFMGVDGRTYEISTGDILTLPGRNAEVLAERDIVLNINQG
jgi:DNA replication factor GINS